MISISETRDFALIKRICSDPAIYGIASADGAPDPKDFEPCRMEGIRYIEVLREGLPMGIWMLVPHSAVCWEIHTAFLPALRGKDAITAAGMFSQWLWTKTGCMRLITNVPAYNRRTVMFCRMVGMTRFGVNEKAFMKDGKLHDLLMFGVSKPGVS